MILKCKQPDVIFEKKSGEKFKIGFGSEPVDVPEHIAIYLLDKNPGMFKVVGSTNFINTVKKEEVVLEKEETIEKPVKKMVVKKKNVVKKKEVLSSVERKKILEHKKKVMEDKK